MSLKYFIWMMISLVALEISSLASSLKDSMSFGINSYSDNADVQVYSPTFSLFKKVSHQWMLGFKMRIDTITAASISNGANSQRVDAVTGASRAEGVLFDDVRYAPTLMATYDDGKNMLSFGAYYSKEADYTGRAVFVNYVRQLNEQNTALGIGISQSSDYWYPVFDRELPRDDRKEGKIDLSLNQLITPGFSLQGVFSYMYSEGFLSSPYHYVLQDGFAKFENYPQTRTGKAFAFKGVYLLNPDNAMNFSYRYYTDDWDIKSHTVNIEELHDFSSHFTSGLRLRYYTQTKSNFVKALGSYSVNDPYFAIDYRMSAFDSYTIGLPFIYKTSKGDKVTASIDYYQTSKNDYIKNWYGVDSIKAVFTTLTYEFEY
ncbi:DUF3570 domain-containing protein [Sulfurimonas sediminis]|uniref:DUF3570 domain-containing protein n=1 Tax=Sulfurimonas sediminis TaxID=2590020 RepID=A0A7M1AYG2_9BACT|nr:DUF3570 domain-containing protein [Sulfurimonas sediminis]QOP42517.1 DUF3570 domain-containing protein [Sulfurimonas sediminis]